MRSLLNQAAAFQHEDPVGIGHRGQPMGDDDGGPAPSQTVQSLMHELFGGEVQARGGLVQNQDGCILQEGAGDGYPLFLSS